VVVWKWWARKSRRCKYVSALELYREIYACRSKGNCCSILCYWLYYLA